MQRNAPEERTPVAIPAADNRLGDTTPIYQCTSAGGPLDDCTGENIAKEITRIHCDATGAPASFVNVLFHQTHDGRHFVAGQRPGHSIVFGAIRQGR